MMLITEAVLPTHHGHASGVRRDMITLAAQPRSVRSARAYVTRVLDDWGLGALGEDVALVVSELVTNAVEASATLWPVVTPLHVCLSAGARWLLLAVADASPRLPLWCSPDDDAERGQGLAVVEALSARWGWHPVTWPGLIKAVWAEFKIGQEGRMCD
jgi:anti-sigma regulatory factor (Ser/Thr protein kinase)